MRRSLTLAVAILTVSGCAPKKLEAALPPTAVLAEGKSSYKFIFDPTNPALNLPADVQFMRPLPTEMRALPKYPEAALAAKDGPHREVVRIVIGTDGQVGEVLDSPMERSDDSLFAADYRRAVDDAVRMWRFRPGVLEHVRDGADNDGDGKPDYKVMTSWDPIAVYYDIRFTFEIVDGAGVVRAGP